MDINNPQSFDHIIGINGEILQPKVLEVWEIELAKVQSKTVVWRKTTADEYHCPAVMLSVGGAVLQLKAVPYGDLDPAKISSFSTLTYRPDTDKYSLPPAMLLETGAILRVKVIEIGVWDMETNQTKIVGHGLTFTNIRSVQVMILRDDSSALYPLNMPDPIAVVSMQGGVSLIDTNTISLMRDTDGYFDHIDFNDGVMNRGFITIWYQD